MIGDVSIPQFLLRAAATWPSAIALVDGETTWTFAELAQHAMCMARKLATIGIARQERVAIFAENSAAFAECMHALGLIEALTIPLNLRLADAELIWQLTDASATTVIYDARQSLRARMIASALPELRMLAMGEVVSVGIDIRTVLPKQMTFRDTIDLATPQAVIYTSGTTGQPKGAIITYGMQWWNAIGSALNLGHHPDDCWLATLPLYHIGGLSILMKNVIYGIRIVITHHFAAAQINLMIQQQHITMVSVVAVMLQRMLDAPFSTETLPGSLRCILLGGGPAPRPLLEACAARLIPVVQTYGMTESCSQSVTLAPHDALRKLGSAGKPLAPVQIRIVKDDVDMEPGMPGEIWLRGPTMTPGYLDRPDATKAAYHDGWFATGDIGTLDEDGYLYVLDRRSDLIISGGENIYPAEIESVLLQHPAVIEAGVIGIPDDVWGQIPVASVVVRDGTSLTAKELIVYAAKHLATYKVPRSIQFRKQLPRNGAGKLLRRILKEELG